MTYQDVAALVARISLAAPVLYIGLSMALDPSGFVAWLQKLTRFLHERSLATRYIRDFHLGPQGTVSAAPSKALRFTGVWLIIGAFLHIAGFLT